MSDTPQRKSLGLVLMGLTLLMWGSLPLQLKILVSTIDPVTLTWYRFTGATLILALIGGRSCLKDLRAIGSRKTWVLLLLAGCGLTANYLSYLSGLSYLTPSTAQIIMQTVPFMVLAGGILIFREPFAGRQWWGVVFLLSGSLLFFNQQFDLIESGAFFGIGFGLIIASAVFWTIFLLSQKALLPVLRSRTILFCCYLIGTLALFPGATPGTILELNTTFLILVGSATLLAVIAYLTFSTGLRHVPATTAGLTIANIPLVTLTCMYVFGGEVDHLPAENLNTTAWFGALLVVVGSAFGALGKRDTTMPTQE